MQYEVRYGNGVGFQCEGSLTQVKRKATEHSPAGESIKIFSNGRLLSMRRRSVSVTTGQEVWGHWEDF